MVQISNVWGFGLAIMASLAAAAPKDCPDGLCLRTRANLSPLEVSQELGPLISNASSIFGPSDSRWANATARYQQYAAPKFTVVVRVARESDVSVIVRLLFRTLKSKSNAREDQICQSQQSSILRS